uniref:Transmembrane protein 188 n=3 Tax=Meloidogyne incognita group TaxID=654580 RepID=A0A914MR76_MELIC
MFINYFAVIEKVMEDPTLAYEDMLFFEHRLTEVIAGMQPRVRKWKAFLLILFVSTTFSAYYWILDPSLKSISFFESLALHPLFTISISLLLILFIVFGVHKRVVAPRIIANRCSTVLSDFCLSCDEQGKLIVRPAYSPAISPIISKQSPSRISTAMSSPPPSSSSPISNLNDENEKNNLLLNNSLNERKTKKEEEKENNIFKLDFTDKNLIQTF